MKKYIIIFALLILLTVYHLYDIKNRERDLSDFTPVTRIVCHGDTIWTMANEFCPETMDKRLYLEYVAEVNGFKDWNRLIYPGDHITMLQLKED